MAMAGERVLSTGYTRLVQEKSTNGFTIYITYKPSAKRIAHAVCGHFMSFYIFVFPFLLMRDLVHDTGDFM